MARLRESQTNWTSGELDPDLEGQMKLKHYFAGASKIRNMLVIPQGGVVRRPGLRHLDEAAPQINQIDLSSAVITAPNGGNVAFLTDGDRLTRLITTNFLGTTDGYVVFHVDLLQSRPVLFIDIDNWWVNAVDDVEGEMFLQGSVDNVVWENLGESLNRTSNTASYLRRRRITAEYRYFRFVRTGDNLADFAAVVNVGELRMWEETAQLSPVVYVNHEFSTFQRYVMAFTDRNMRVYFENAPVADVPTEYTSDKLETATELGNISITFTSLDDTLLIFHEDERPRRFQRQGFNHEWDPADWVLNNLPTYNFGSGNEPIFSDARGWPRCGTFFGGRLWLAGSPSRPQTLLASRLGNFEDFNTSTTDDDFGINVTADVDQIAAIFQLYAGRHLQAFSSSAEFYVPVSDTQGVTPKNIVLRRTTQIGARRSVPVFEVDGASIFLSTTATNLREFIFTDTEQAYLANSISKLASHLIRTPVTIAYRKSLGLSEPDYIWLVNSDGTLAAFCTLRQEQVNAMTLCDTEGRFLHAVVSRTESYFAVEREINGVTRRFIEVFDSSLHMDAAVSGTGQVDRASGLDHLEGKTVGLYLDEVYAGTAVVSGGEVLFGRFTKSSWEVGLLWPYQDPDNKYRAWVKSLPIEGNLPDGTQLGMRKGVKKIGVRLRETTSLTLNGFRIPFQQFGSNLLDQPISPFTGDKVLRGLLGNGLQARVEFGLTEPGELSVLASSYWVRV